MRGSLRAGLAAAALAVVAWWTGSQWHAWYEQQPTFAHSYRTPRGELLDVALPDGSRVQLDTATRIEVTLYRHRRQVRLFEGQALFNVSSIASASRARPSPGSDDAGVPRVPFEVLAGDLRVSVVGTRFAVRYTQAGIGSGQVNVAVEEGMVRVGSALAGTSAPPLSGDDAELHGGQRVARASDGSLGPVLTIAPGAAAAWLGGRLSFENTPLAEALAEFERYGATGLVIGDPQVGAMRIGGSFEVRRLDAFTGALPRMLPVRLERHGASTEIVAIP